MLLAVLSGVGELIATMLIYPFLLMISNGGGQKEVKQEQWIMEAISGITNAVGVEANVSNIAYITIFVLCSTCAIRLTSYRYSSLVSAWIGTDLSTKAFGRTLYRPYEEIINLNSSDIIGIIAVQTDHAVYAIKSLLQLLSTFIANILIILGLTALNPRFTLVVLLIVALYYILISAWARVRLQRNSTLLTSCIGQNQRILRDGLKLSRDIIIDSSQEIYIEHLRNNDRVMRQVQVSSEYVAIFPKFILESITMSSLLAYIAANSAQTSGANSILPFLGTLAIASQRLVPGVQQIYSQWAQINSMKSSIRNVLYLIESGKVKNNDGADALPMHNINKLIVKDIAFKYTNSITNVIQELSFTLQKGEIFGIVGKSGSGKSTIIDLVLGLIKPSRGSIIVDGIDLYRNFGTVMSWRKTCAHVPQTIYMVDGTINKNICLTKEMNEGSIKNVKTAAVNAQIHDFIMGLKDGYESRVGDEGIFLSGGQRQRIGIARALYKNSEVLVIDEGTSALDANTEDSLIKYLSLTKHDRITIIVTHNKRLLKYCDDFLDLDQLHGR